MEHRPESVTNPPAASPSDPSTGRPASEETFPTHAELSCRSTDFGLGPDRDATQTAALVGSDLGEFRVERLLAQGGMGRVYLARQRSPDRTVAVKVMRSTAATAIAGQRFQREAELLGRLRHPGIAKVYTAGSCLIAGEETPYFVMEYVIGGEPLVRACDRGGLGVPQRLELLADVCAAVGHGHAAGIVHRDLKPANILVDAEGRAKVIDFGVARIAEDDAGGFTETGVFVGTRQYMSPEQCDGGVIGPWTDVYALGVILHELLSGRLPYEVAGRSLTETARIVREQPPRRLQVADHRLGPGAEAIAAKCLAKSPADRYPTAAEMATDVRSLLAGLPITARRPGLIATCRTWARQHRVLVVASLAAGLTAAVMSVALVNGRNDHSRPQLTPGPGPTASIPTIASTRSTPLQWVSVDFSEPVRSLSASDFRLTRDGLPVPLDTVTVVGMRERWELRGLDTVTATAGHYRLSLVGTPTTPLDLAGRRLAAPVEITWQMPPYQVVSFNLLDEGWEQYVVSMNDVERYTERSAGPATFIRPTVLGQEGSVVMRFSAPFEIRSANLAAGVAVWTTGDPFPYDPGARAALDVSPDGVRWTNLVTLEANRGGFGGGPFDIGEFVAGGREIWVRARLTGTREWPGDGPIYAQFLRCDPEHPDYKLRLWMSGPSPVPPPPDGGAPADG
jgi:serine/threonine protein kinase